MTLNMATSSGQGKRATTILTESGWHYPVISERTYVDRSRVKTSPCLTDFGARPMHRTTLLMCKPPWDPETGFKTTNKHYFGDIGLNHSSRRPPKCRSMHNHHFQFGNKAEEVDKWHSQYEWEHRKKELIPANRLHKVSLVNRIDQTEGMKMKQVFQTDLTEPTYWTQYKRIHNKLGVLLGPGEARPHPVRQQYNLITGEMVGPSWKEENRRVSGSRLLNEVRQRPENKILIN